MTTARWLTPNAPQPHKQFTRRLVIPAASDFLGLVNGALFELCQQKNWQQDGDMTPQETADWFLAWWREYLNNENEPPNWDTAENVDGQPAQPWYEQLEDWIIQGFLAITFTPLAALVYQTTVPKIRVAIRTGNIGALFKVLINGIEVWTGDSYAPIIDLIDQTFDNPNPGSAATVQVIHYGNGPNVSGESKLEFVRGEAVESMVATILRADPGGCGIQWSTDNGGQWETIDLVECIQTLAGGQIDQYILEGKIAVPGGQPGGMYPPIPGQCKTFHVVLGANSQWMLPFGLYYGDTVRVQNLTGAWSDGSPAWFCPDGTSFGLGVCGPGGQTHETGDVLNPGDYHMALVMQVGSTWYTAPVSAEFKQTSGITPLAVMFQANDGSLSDNTGTIEFDLLCCSETEYDWCHTVDFSQSDGGYTPPPGTGGVWIDGLGWKASQQANGYWNVVIANGWTSSNVVRVVMEGTWLTTHKAAEVRILNGATTILSYSGLLNQPFQFDTHAIDIASGGLSFYVMTDAGLGFADNVITRVTIYGKGTSPFGASNC